MTVNCHTVAPPPAPGELRDPRFNFDPLLLLALVDLAAAHGTMLRNTPRRSYAIWGWTLLPPSFRSVADVRSLGFAVLRPRVSAVRRALVLAAAPLPALSLPAPSPHGRA